VAEFVARVALAGEVSAECGAVGGVRVLHDGASYRFCAGSGRFR
jgi:hypothetical protein